MEEMNKLNQNQKIKAMQMIAILLISSMINL